jgi:hypothetical protein
MPPPAIVDDINSLRQLLYDSAKRDLHPPLCDFSKDPADVFYPHGEDVECRMRHARMYSEFRKGIGYAFQNYQSTKQDDLANQLVEPLIKMLMVEGRMSEPEARDIVWAHYEQAYGHFPPPPKEPTDPSRTPAPVPGLLPGDGPPADAAPEQFTIPGDEVGNGVEEDDILAPAPSEPEFPWVWVAVGAGALALLGGGYYLATRK